MSMTKREEPRALAMAREIRRGEASYGPSAIYAAAEGDSDLFGHAMKEAGYIVPVATGEPSLICDECGYDFSRVLEVPRA